MPQIKNLNQLPELNEKEFSQKYAKLEPFDDGTLANPDLWKRVSLDELVGKKPVSLRLDYEIIDFFKERAKDKNSKYQTDINQVLKGFVKAQKEKQQSR